MKDPSRREVLAIAWPIVLANSAAPLLGIADTAVIGNVGTVEELGAIALGALIFSFVYWSFGFLRMGTTGFTAQAIGAKDEAEVRAVLGRALLLALAIGLLLVALQRPIAWVALQILGASEAVEAITLDYYSIRIWAAPASLATFAISGTFVGLAESKRILKIQLFLNGLNVVLDVLFAGILRWGVAGIALGTAIAEWCTLALALFMIHRVLSARRTDREPFFPWARIRTKVTRTLTANADIMIRTVLLLGGFAWFTDRSAQFGDTVLAANHILLQLVSFSAYFLDGYAFAVESLVGRAIGSGRRDAFDLAVRRTTELAAVTAILLALAILSFGRIAVHLLTDLDGVRETAAHHLLYTAIYVLLSFAAFQLDGIFIGATRTRDMRNASIASLFAFLGLSWLLVPHHQNDGLWLAFIGYVVARAIALLAYYPALRRSIGA